jgi:hypothetical protein
MLKLLNTLNLGVKNPAQGVNIANVTRKYNSGSVNSRIEPLASVTMPEQTYAITTRNIFDIGAWVRGLISAAALPNHQELHIGELLIKTHYISDTQFGVLPFKVTMENGETITTNDAAGFDIMGNIEDALGEGAHIEFMGTAIRFAVYNPGDGKYHLKVDFRPSKMVEDIVRDFYTKEMNETAPGYLEGFLGHCVTGTSAQVVSIRRYTTYTQAVGSRVRRIPGI